MGATLVRDQGTLADATIGLAQPHSCVSYASRSRRCKHRKTGKFGE
jgi:hypothetical protein